jgi:hypothetical protein
MITAAKRCEDASLAKEEDEEREVEGERRCQNGIFIGASRP